LLYHRITADGSQEMPGYGLIKLSDFKQQLDYLKEAGYETIDTGQLYQYITQNTSLPAKPIMLSFDDANLSDYEIAFPLLKTKKFQGVFL